MQIKKILLVLPLTAILPFYANAADKNEFDLYLGSDVDSLSFDYVNSHVPILQLSTDHGLVENKIITTSTAKYLKLVYEVDRQGSSDVADSFVCDRGESSSGCNPPSKMTTIYSVNADRPEKLNFYFSGNLKINGYPVRGLVDFGQGHTNDKNNWWIGSYYGYSFNPPVDRCLYLSIETPYTSSGYRYFEVKQKSHSDNIVNEFMINKSPVDDIPGYCY